MQMDDIMSFYIEAEERGLLHELPPRILPKESEPKPLPRRGKKAARAKRQRADR
jgi:hypothetical protein